MPLYLVKKEGRLAIQRKVLKSCLRFLARFICNENENQVIVSEDITILMRLLKHEQAVGVESLLKELFLNNKDLLKDSANVEKFCAITVKSINDIKDHEEDHTYKSAEIMNILQSLMKYKDTVLKKNQTIVLTQITRPDFDHILFNLTKEQLLQHSDFKGMLDSYSEALMTLGNRGYIALPPTVDYMIELLDVMSMSSEEKNAATESKCQYCFPLKLVATLITISGKCYPLKRALLYFLFHVYLDTEILDSQMIEEKLILGRILQVSNRTDRSVTHWLPIRSY